MAWTLEQIFAILGTVGLTSVAVSGLVVFLTKTWLSERIKGEIKHEYDTQLETLKARLKSEADIEIEKLKAQLKSGSDAEIERLKSQLSIAASQQQIRFARLHERRAEVIAQIYASLREAVTAVGEYTKAFEPAGGSSREDRRSRAVEAANEFARVLRMNQIYVPEAAAKKLDEINQELKGTFFQFAYGVDLMPNGRTDTTKNWLEVVTKLEKMSKIAIRELEKEFRILLGDEGTSTASS